VTTRAPFVAFWIVLVLAATVGTSAARKSAARNGNARHQHRLALTDLSVPQILRRIVKPSTLIVTDPFNAAMARRVGIGKVVVVHDNRQDHLHRTLRQAGRYDEVVGLGGCTALDASNVAAMGKRRFTKVPLLSTACISTNKAIIRKIPTLRQAITRLLHHEPLFRKKKIFGSVPDQTIVSYDYHLRHRDRKAINRWIGSAYGDLFGGLSAAMDTVYQNIPRYTVRDVRRIAVNANAALSFADRGLVTIDASTIRNIAKNVHEANVNGSKVAGGEHQLYYAMFNKYRRYRRPASGATHGQIVAAGTLMAAWVMARQTGDLTLYQQLQRAYKKLDLPTNRSELATLGIKPRHLVDGLTRVTGDTLLGHHVAKEKRRASALVDQVFR
jgi:glycerol dehydrogenase-like iron-containing ADH family enzyme